MAGKLVQVTAPCGACSAEVRFGERRCVACGAPVSRAVLQALDRRLQAADPALRGMANDVSSAAGVLLLIALAHVGFALFRYYVAHDPGMAAAVEGTSTRTAVLGDLAVSAAMVLCFLWARRAPLPALSVALVAWLAVQGVTITIGGIVLISGWLIMVRIGILVALVRGIVAAALARRLRARLAPPRPEALPPARARARTRR